MIGRAATFLVDMPVEIQPSGWRLTGHPGRDLQRAKDFVARDLDALEEQADGYAGALKVQVAGPWTLAAGLELPSGHRVITDQGATRDLVESLIEGLRDHVTDLGRRVPGAHVVVQLDEPSLPAALSGQLSTPSGYGTVRAIEASTARQVLHSVLEVLPSGGRVVHCCATSVPFALLRSAGAEAISFDQSLLGSRDNDHLGETIDAGVALWLGVLPTTDTRITVDTVRDPIRRLWHELGFAEEQLASAVVPTPACGLAAASPAYTRRVLAVLREAGRSLLRDET